MMKSMFSMPGSIWEIFSQNNRRVASSGKFLPRGFDALVRLSRAHSIEDEFQEVRMSLRPQFTEQLKAAMRAGDAPRVSTLRMIMAKLKDSDIASRPKGIPEIPDDEILAMLRGMVKSRRESVELYQKGGRPELAAKEEAEIALIESFLPARMDDAALEAAVADAIASTGAAGVKEMGRVMAALKAKYGAALDMSRAGPLVKARLG
jgi:uncharacterized protein